MGNIYLFRIGKSEINGQGLICTAPIPRGRFVGLIEGPVRKMVIRGVEDSCQNPNWVGFKENHWIDPDPPFRYINHSCKPNCGISGTKKVFAMHDISSGEELTFDYSISEIDLHWSLICECGSENCRREIRSIQSLPAGVINGYLPYIPTAFQKYASKA